MKTWLIVATLFVTAAGPGVARAEPDAVQEVSVRAFIEEVARRTGRTFFVDPRVQGEIAAPADMPGSREALLSLFFDALQVNGYRAVPSVAGAYRILPADPAVEAVAL